MPESRPLPAAAPAAAEAAGLAEATLAARRLEDVSDVLLLAAYGLSLLALALGAGPAFAAAGLAFEWRLLSALGGLLVSAVMFVMLKYLSEATRALADLARTAARVERKLDALAAGRPADVDGPSPGAAPEGVQSD